MQHSLGVDVEEDQFSGTRAVALSTALLVSHVLREKYITSQKNLCNFAYLITEGCKFVRAVC